MKTVSKPFTYDENIFSDLHKDAYGFRPRYATNEFYSATPERKQQIWDETTAVLKQSIQEEKDRQNEASLKFEESLRQLMEKGAANRETAIRWFIESTMPSKYDLCYGGGYLCYELGLSYDRYKAELDQIIKAGGIRTIEGTIEGNVE